MDCEVSEQCIFLGRRNIAHHREYGVRPVSGGSILWSAELHGRPLSIGPHQYSTVGICTDIQVWNYQGSARYYQGTVGYLGLG